MRGDGGVGVAVDVGRDVVVAWEMLVLFFMANGE